MAVKNHKLRKKRRACYFSYISNSTYSVNRKEFLPLPLGATLTFVANISASHWGPKISKILMKIKITIKIEQKQKLPVEVN